jgi:hypothetical protein
MREICDLSQWRRKLTPWTVTVHSNLMQWCGLRRLRGTIESYFSTFSSAHSIERTIGKFLDFRWDSHSSEKMLNKSWKHELKICNRGETRSNLMTVWRTSHISGDDLRLICIMIQDCFVLRSLSQRLPGHYLRIPPRIILLSLWHSSLISVYTDYSNLSFQSSQHRSPAHKTFPRHMGLCSLPRVISIGDFSVGKTSIITRATAGSFEPSLAPPPRLLLVSIRSPSN